MTSEKIKGPTSYFPSIEKAYGLQTLDGLATWLDTAMVGQ